MSENEMIERVARAVVAKISEIDLGSDAPWDDPGFREDAMAVARAAIEAMREPSENMLFQAHRATGGDILVGESRELWNAMIDAALKTASP